MHYARQSCAECISVLDQTAQRCAADVDTVVGSFARNKAHALSLAARPMVGERDFDRRIDRLGSGIAEKDVIEITRCQRRDAPRQLEPERVRRLKRRTIIEFSQLFAYRFGDLRSPMSCSATKKSGRAVKDLLTLTAAEVHALRLDK
jgi:hypothetical protein